MDIQDWVGSYKTEYTYDSDGSQLSSTSYSWSSDEQAWVGSYKTEYSYDSDGSQLSSTSYSWSSDEQAWVGSYKGELTYDSDGNLLSTTSYSWSSDAQDWEKISKGYYFYSNSGSSSIEDINSNISIYPNPADDQIMLQMESNDYSSLVVRNITGQILMQEQINDTQMQLDISALESGLYLIELQGKEKSITQKIVIR